MLLATLELEMETEMDLIEEMRLRTWARQNYTSVNDRELDWHPIILDEMGRKDRENARN